MSDRSTFDDPRWQAITQLDTKCICCGLPTNEILSFAYDRPSMYLSDAKVEENYRLLETDGDILTEDFCRLDKYRFIRSTLSFPLQGLPDQLVIGVWATTSITNFDRMVEQFDIGQQGDIGDMGSWLANAVPANTETPVAVIMRPQNMRQRPQILFQDDHPLSKAQRLGLTFDEFANLLSSFGHDIESMLRKH